MKHLSRKKLLLIMVISVTCCIATIFAESKNKSIKSYLASSFKYTINGKAALADSPTIIYKDTLYAPVEELAKALGHEITIKDGTISIATCGLPCPSSTPKPVPSPTVEPTPSATPLPTATPTPTGTPPASPMPTGAPVGEKAVIQKATIVRLDPNAKTLTIAPSDKDNKPENHIILRITPNTVITDCKAKKMLSDLTTQTPIKVVHSTAMTKSIPPQTEAYEIIILESKSSTCKPR